MNTSCSHVLHMHCVCVGIRTAPAFCLDLNAGTVWLLGLLCAVCTMRMRKEIFRCKRIETDTGNRIKILGRSGANIAIYCDCVNSCTMHTSTTNIYAQYTAQDTRIQTNTFNAHDNIYTIISFVVH